MVKRQKGTFLKGAGFLRETFGWSIPYLEVPPFWRETIILARLKSKENEGKQGEYYSKLNSFKSPKFR